MVRQTLAVSQWAVTSQIVHDAQKESDRQMKTGRSVENLEIMSTRLF
jgi:hypothetical protein